MPINTVFPVNQGFGGVPANVVDPYSSGPGVNNEHPVGVEAGSVAPGVGIAETVKEPSSPGPGVNNEHPVGVEAGSVAPGRGVASESPAFGKAPSSAPNPNITNGGAMAPGLGAVNDSADDNSNNDSGHGPVDALHTNAALGVVEGGTYMPGGAPINVSQNYVAGQAFGLGLPLTFQGGVR